MTTIRHTHCCNSREKRNHLDFKANRSVPVVNIMSGRIMFAVDDIAAVVARMLAHGAELIGEMQYEDTCRLAYIRGPEGIIVALAEQLG